MRKSVALTISAILLLAGLSSCVMVQPSGILVQRDYYYQNFTNVEIDSAFQATIIQSSSSRSISLTIDQNAESYLNVYQTGNTVHIGLNPGISASGGLNLKATITMPSISSLSVSGASTVSLNSFSPGVLNVGVSGASTAVLAGMNIGTAYLTVSGASTLRSNSSYVNTVTVQVSGASTLSIPVQYSASGNVTGSSTFIYGYSTIDLTGLTTEFPSSSHQ